jgi:integrase
MKPPQDRTASTLSFHSTRHFFVSALLAGGVPSDVRQRLAGHTVARTHAVYSAHEIESMRATVAKLPGVSIAG